MNDSVEALGTSTESPFTLRTLLDPNAVSPIHRDLVLKFRHASIPLTGIEPERIATANPTELEQIRKQLNRVATYIRDRVREYLETAEVRSKTAATDMHFYLENGGMSFVDELSIRNTNPDELRRTLMLNRYRLLYAIIPIVVDILLSDDEYDQLGEDDTTIIFRSLLREPITRTNVLMAQIHDLHSHGQDFTLWFSTQELDIMNKNEFSKRLLEIITKIQNLSRNSLLEDECGQTCKKLSQRLITHGIETPNREELLQTFSDLHAAIESFVQGNSQNTYPWLRYADAA